MDGTVIVVTVLTIVMVGFFFYLNILIPIRDKKNDKINAKKKDK